MGVMDSVITNYGILCSVSWNSNQWADEPTTQDLKVSKYDYVKSEAHMHESLNFGHDVFPAEVDGSYIGYTPMFNTPPAEDNSRNVDIVFFMSSDYRNGNRKSIIGLYGFPEFGEWYTRTASHPLFQKYDNGNIKAFPENIIYFDTPIVIDNDFVQQNALLPTGKLISHRGFNYLHSDNVFNLISLAIKLNPKNKKLQGFVMRFPLLVNYKQEMNALVDFYDVVDGESADTLKGIASLERKMAKQAPEVKQRISNYIERGSIATKSKRLAGYKCLLCEAMNQNPYSFKKPNGEYYIEAHHVEAVSTLKKGVLSINNLITVCANHHRQLHYGQAEVASQTATAFEFVLDGQRVKVNKIRVE